MCVCVCVCVCVQPKLFKTITPRCDERSCLGGGETEKHSNGCGRRRTRSASEQLISGSLRDSWFRDANVPGKTIASKQEKGAIEKSPPLTTSHRPSKRDGLRKKKKNLLRKWCVENFHIKVSVGLYVFVREWILHPQGFRWKLMDKIEGAMGERGGDIGVWILIVSELRRPQHLIYLWSSPSLLPLLLLLLHPYLLLPPLSLYPNAPFLYLSISASFTLSGNKHISGDQRGNHVIFWVLRPPCCCPAGVNFAAQYLYVPFKHMIKHVRVYSCPPLEKREKKRKCSRHNSCVGCMHFFMCVCVCVPWEEAAQHSPMLQALSRECVCGCVCGGGDVLATAVNEEKKEGRESGGGGEVL